MNCPCQSGRTYAACCGPYLEGEAWPPTPEAVMRARYAAFASGKIDFLEESQEPASRDGFDREVASSWSSRADWAGFELLATAGGGADDDAGSVEFVAHYTIDGQERAHHELARFAKVDGRWYFVDGVVAGQQTYRREAPKVGRNDACPCGSGRKHKKCCGATAR